jgi:hypothetical protein
VRPQKFKVDVTDFFKPKVSAALQLVLSIKNTNMLRSMLLEQCKLTAYDAETGLKLGSTQQGSVVLSPFSTTSATISLQGLANSLPQPEQRRCAPRLRSARRPPLLQTCPSSRASRALPRSLAASFLSKKALLLTIVATASSRLPVKGSKAESVSTNSSRRIDLSALTKEPFFQRAQAPPPEETGVHDVPL